MESQPADARASLDAISDVVTARTRRTRTPGWAWQAQGLTFVLIGVALVLPPLPQMLLILASIVVGVTATTVLRRRSGFNPVYHDARDWVAPLSISLPVLVVAALCWTIGGLLHWAWIAPVAGVACYLTVIVLGPIAERRTVRR